MLLTINFMSCTVLQTFHHVITKYSVYFCTSVHMINTHIIILLVIYLDFFVHFLEECCVKVLCLCCRGCVVGYELGFFLVCSWAGPARLQTLLLWKALLTLQIVSSAAWLLPVKLWPTQIALSLSSSLPGPFWSSHSCIIFIVLKKQNNFSCFCYSLS